MYGENTRTESVGASGKAIGMLTASREFAYEKYISEMHQLITKLEDKIRPCCLDFEGSVRLEKPTFPSSGTRLETELRGVMERLDRVVDAVIL